jgi:hypothetical protein
LLLCYYSYCYVVIVVITVIAATVAGDLTCLGWVVATMKQSQIEQPFIGIADVRPGALVDGVVHAVHPEVAFLPTPFTSILLPFLMNFPGGPGVSDGHSEGSLQRLAFGRHCYHQATAEVQAWAEVQVPYSRSKRC